jgi:choline kinase
MDKRKKKLNNFTAIFLLAGFGRRISKLTQDPKCLLKINNQTIIQRNLKILKKLNIKKVVFVIGYKSNLIKQHLKNFQNDFKITYAYNRNYKKNGNTFSLLKGLKKSQGKIIIFDGDLIFSKKILSEFIFKGHSSSFLIGKGSIRNIECAKALIDKNGYIKKTVDKRLILKKELKEYRFIGEAIGIIKIENSIRKSMLIEIKKFLKKKYNQKLNWEHFMNKFLIKNFIKFNKTTNPKWIEIDTKQDYAKAKLLFKNK